jgi:preprotein translocase subunit SecA
VIFRKRLEYLLADNAPSLINEGEKADSRECEIILSAINEVWCDYLEYTSELRTGIHLRAVAGRNPSEEYNIDCERYFEGLEEKLLERVKELEAEKESGDSPALFRPKNARTFLMEESGDELVRRPILTNLFIEDDDDEQDK